MRGFGALLRVGWLPSFLENCADVVLDAFRAGGDRLPDLDALVPHVHSDQSCGLLGLSPARALRDGSVVEVDGQQRCTHGHDFVKRLIGLQVMRPPINTHAQLEGRRDFVLALDVILHRFHRTGCIEG